MAVTLGQLEELVKEVKQAEALKQLKKVVLECYGPEAVLVEPVLDYSSDDEGGTNCYISDLLVYSTLDASYSTDTMPLLSGVKNLEHYEALSSVDAEYLPELDYEEKINLLELPEGPDLTKYDLIKRD